MEPEQHLSDITRLIQLAIAPVFLMSAIGAILNVLSTRLGRVADRMRAAENHAVHEHIGRDPEIDALDRRLHLIYLAIVAAVVGALCIGFLIAIAFADALLQINLARIVGALFVAALACIITSLCLYLREIVLAIGGARSRREQRIARATHMPVD